MLLEQHARSLLTIFKKGIYEFDDKVLKLDGCVYLMVISTGYLMGCIKVTTFCFLSVCEAYFAWNIYRKMNVMLTFPNI